MIARLLPLCLAVLLSAQDAARVSQRPPTVRVTTRLIEIDAVVQDKYGRPVTDLTKDDFVVLDKGVEQKIAVFAFEPGKPSAPAATLEPLLPDTVTNATERRMARQSNPTVILIDAINTDVKKQVEFRPAVVKFFQQLHPEDRVAVYVLTSTLKVVHDFTNDTASLLAALEKYQPQSTPHHFDSHDVNHAFIYNVSDPLQLPELVLPAQWYQRRRVETTLKALEAIAEHFAPLPGRKNLVWLSGSFPLDIGNDLAVSMHSTNTCILDPSNPECVYDRLDRTNFGGRIQRVSRLITNANVAVYPIDFRGTSGPLGVGNFAEANEQNPHVGRQDYRDPRWRAEQEIVRTHETMTAVADWTGGRATYDSNNIQHALRQALDDAASSYYLAYYPSNTQWDGRFREIKVKVRRPGLRLMHRKGYMAVADQPESDEQRNQALETATWSPIEATRLTLNVTVRRLAAGPDGGTGATPAQLDIRLDPKQLMLAPVNGVPTAQLDMKLVQASVEGQALDLVDHKCEIPVSPAANKPGTAPAVITLRFTLKLQPNVHQLRIALRDRRNAALGSVIIPRAKLPLQ